MKKWNVTANFTIQAEDRKQAWLEANKICQRHFRDLVNVERVSEIELLDTSQIIAVNEPIRGQAKPVKVERIAETGEVVVSPLDKG